MRKYGKGDKGSEQLDEQFGARPAFVALTQNGQPLSAADGPYRIIMAGETHRARWVRQLSTLRVVRAGDAAQQVVPNED